MSTQRNSLELGRRIDVFVGQKLARSLEEKNVGIDQLANHIGVSPNQIQNYLSGRSRIGAGRLFEMAVYLQVPAVTFFPSLTCEELLDEENSRGVEESRSIEPRLRVYLNTGKKSIAVKGDDLKTVVNGT